VRSRGQLFFGHNIVAQKCNVLDSYRLPLTQYIGEIHNRLLKWNALDRSGPIIPVLLK